MIHREFAELKQWEGAKYAAGYRARFGGFPVFETAHYCWCAGWEDADMEILESKRHNRVVAEGGEDEFPQSWLFLFDAGGDARINGIPFDRERTQPWKEGWIDADINLGVCGGEFI